MNWTTVEQNWAAYTPRVLTRWPGLDEDEVLATDGDLDRFAEYLAIATSQTVQAARDEARGWADGEEPADAKMDPTRDNERIFDSAKNIPVGEDVYSADADFGDDRIPEPPMDRQAG